MTRLSSWELRQRAEDQGMPVGGTQFKSFVAWGLIPERPDGGWAEADVERLVRIRRLEAEARPLHRRTILLRDTRWPTPPAKLREAMVETIPGIRGATKKLRNVYRAGSVLSGDVAPERAASLTVPPDWRPPDREQWIAAFGWPTDEEFDLIAGSVYHQAFALTRHPRVVASGVLEAIPFEELVVLLMTRQLTISDWLPVPQTGSFGETEDRA